MNKTPLPEKVPEQEQVADELLPEYKFDYGKARPNRFAANPSVKRVIALAPDVAAVFTT